MCFDPWVSEWGNPAGVMPCRRKAQTRGSETSQYPEEKKSNEIPLVEAIETGTAQTGVQCTPGL